MFGYVSICILRSVELYIIYCGPNPLASVTLHSATMYVVVFYTTLLHQQK